MFVVVYLGWGRGLGSLDSEGVSGLWVPLVQRGDAMMYKLRDFKFYHQCYTK